jgi:hypothetical protein
LVFLRKVLEDSPANGIDPIDKWQDPQFGGQPAEYYLLYFGKQTPSSWAFELPKSKLGDGMKFKAEVLDTWNMTTESVPGVFIVKKKNDYVFAEQGGRAIALQGKPYIAIRLKRVKE